MRAHDRAAIRDIPRFSLTILRYSRGCLQTVEVDGLTERQVGERKAHERECWSGYELDFEVVRS